MSINKDYSFITREQFHYLRYKLGYKYRIGMIIQIIKSGIALFEYLSPPAVAAAQLLR